MKDCLYSSGDMLVLFLKSLLKKTSFYGDIIEIKNHTIKSRYWGRWLNFGTFKILLKAYICAFLNGHFSLTDHDEIKWVDAGELNSFNLAPADIPLVQKIIDYKS